jgi:hypothetical protein
MQFVKNTQYSYLLSLHEFVFTKAKLLFLYKHAFSSRPVSKEFLEL